MRAPDFWKRRGPVAMLLSPLAALYTAGGRLNRAARPSWQPPVPVVCVGNVVAGGAGKTPTAIAVAARLQASGLTPHFLSRGYGGSARGPLRVDPERHDSAAVGDEPLLLAARYPAWVSRERRAGVAAAAAAGADVVVMDDGLQNPSVAKTRSLVVVDGGYGFGNGKVLPAGPLREPVDDALARADAAVLIGDDQHDLAPALNQRLLLLRGRLTPAPNGDAVAGQRVVAFAGIGRPQKFFATLRDMGCDLRARFALPDHYRYRPEDIMQICERADDEDAIPVTTEKDYVRLPAEARIMVRFLPVQLEWDTADAALDRLLAGL